MVLKIPKALIPNTLKHCGLPEISHFKLRTPKSRKARFRKIYMRAVMNKFLDDFRINLETIFLAKI